MAMASATGIRVQRISSRVLPWNCLASRPGRSRNARLKISVAAMIATNTAAASQNTIT